MFMLVLTVPLRVIHEKSTTRSTKTSLLHDIMHLDVSRSIVMVGKQWFGSLVNWLHG
jgi:hypothetical protein